MNKAFTRESDYDPSLEIVARPRDTLPAGVKNYITPAGASQLRDELRVFVEEMRPALLEQISQLVASGRRNGRAHQETRHRLRQAEQQIAWLEERVASLEVVDPATANSNGDRVRFGATVTVADEHHRQQRWRIVGVDEAEPSAGTLSWISPIARALLSRQVGDEVEVTLPRGQVRLEILEVRYGTDAD